MSITYKLLIQELYDSGSLCLCKSWIVLEQEEDRVERTRLVHEENCIGRDKVKELLNS